MPISASRSRSPSNECQRRVSGNCQEKNGRVEELEKKGTRQKLACARKSEWSNTSQQDCSAEFKSITTETEH
jgi:hypothetical protein